MQLSFLILDPTPWTTECDNVTLTSCCSHWKQVTCKLGYIEHIVHHGSFGVTHFEQHLLLNVSSTNHLKNSSIIRSNHLWCIKLTIINQKLGSCPWIHWPLARLRWITGRCECSFTTGLSPLQSWSNAVIMDSFLRYNSARCVPVHHSSNNFRGLAL